MINFWNRMKDRFKAESNTHMWIILTVFSLTGCTIAYVVKPFIFDLIGITESTWYIKLVCWLIVILPSYYIFLILYGGIFGQFRYFYNWIFKREKVKKGEV